MQTQHKTKATIALKKAKSNLEKILQMIEDEKYCIDIIQQNLAVIGLLKSANFSLLENHFQTCMQTVFATKNRARQNQMIKELLKVISTAQNK